MAVIYGAVAALCWGWADFAARGVGARLGALRTVLYAQMVGLLGLLALVDWPRVVGPAALPMLALGAALGLMYTLGTVLLYYALAQGRLAVVSPISASYATVTLALSLLAGAAISPVKLGSLLLTIVGVILVSLSGGDGAAPGVSPRARDARGTMAALASAALFGVALWGYGYVVPTLGLWVPVLERNLAGIIVLPLCALPLRQSVALPPRSSWASLIAIGIVDTGGTAAYNRGLGGDVPGVVATLGSLFSVVTVILAYVVLGERLSRRQWGGVAIIFSATVLIGLVTHGAAA